MAFVALSSAAFAVIIGAPLAQDLMNNPADSKVQLGQYLTIPGLAAIGLMAVVLVLPFGVGFLWATGRMLRKA